MATEISMLNPQTGLTKKGYVGFSWTTFFFGMFPALFRADFITFLCGFVILIVIAILTYGIGSVVAYIAWAFMYNRYYTRKLIERGYRLNDTTERNALAVAKLGMTAPMPVTA